MTRYLLDTNGLIDYSKNREPGLSALNALLADSSDAEEVAVCGIQVAELVAGLPPGDRPLWQRFLNDLTYWNITIDIAVRAGIYRYTYARQGKSLATTDTLIAAVAYTHDAIIVTSNVRDFPMPDVRLLALIN